MSIRRRVRGLGLVLSLAIAVPLLGANPSAQAAPATLPSSQHASTPSARQDPTLTNGDPNDMMGQSGLTRRQLYKQRSLEAQHTKQLPPGKAYTGPPSNFKPECPKTLTCKWVPAAHAKNSDAPYDYGNYSYENRPKSLAINQIVIHETEGDLASSLANFQDPNSYVSVQYTIDTDGRVYQSVRLRDLAYQAGNYYVNMHSVGIEHVGYSEENGITDAQYQSSARLSKWLSHKFGFPLNRSTVIGHDNVPGTDDRHVASMHWDPGPYWDWNRYMKLLGAPAPSKQAGTKSQVVTIYPDYAGNLQALMNCTVTPCVPVPATSSNFLPLYTAPSTSAPLLSDPYLHADGAAGTTRQDDWGDKAPTGVEYVVAERKPGWTAIWFSGEKAWFQDDGTVTRAAHARVATAKSGQTVPVYGRPVPEATAKGWQKIPDGPDYQLAQEAYTKYTLAPGQAYVLERHAVDDYAESCSVIDCSYPGDGVVVHGKTKYLQISYNHRIGYVNVKDVSVHQA